MHRVDLAALAAWAAYVSGLGEDVALAHLLSDNRIAAAQSGWVGTSAVALDTTAAAWLQASRRLLGRLGDHALNLTDDAFRFAEAEDTHRQDLGALGPA